MLAVHGYGRKLPAGIHLHLDHKVHLDPEAINMKCEIHQVICHASSCQTEHVKQPWFEFKFVCLFDLKTSVNHLEIQKTGA